MSKTSWYVIHLYISTSLTIQYPYALSALKTSLPALHDNPAFETHLSAFPPEHTTSDAALLAHVTQLTQSDTKAAYWKALQGFLWKTGYETAALRCPMFPDVAPALRSFRAQDRTIVIYSSGSVEAQKLCFAHASVLESSEPSTTPPPAAAATEDLTALISHYFDTTNAGSKTDAASYTKIYESLVASTGASQDQDQDQDRGDTCTPPPAPEQFTIDDCLFLSDSVREVREARKAGMQSWIVERPGNAFLTSEDRWDQLYIRSFDEVHLA